MHSCCTKPPLTNVDTLLSASESRYSDSMLQRQCMRFLSDPSAALALSVSVCLSVCLCLCLSLSVSVCLSVSVSLFLSVSVSLFLSLSVSVSLFLSVCLSVCLSVSLSLSLSLFRLNVPVSAGKAHPFAFADYLSFLEGTNGLYMSLCMMER